MIIKKKRIKARGQALSRALRHVMDGEDNDAVVLVRGNVADLDDARADALRFGREYAVRHWTLSPGVQISDEQLADAIARLAAEFGFDPERTVIWKHTKSRATPDGCNQHFHVMVPEVDPLTGGVMSSSHDYARHEKLARSLELAWSHAIVPGSHTKAVVAALDREDAADLAKALRQTPPVDHPQSFDEADHQRLKRAGLDLPRLRIMITEALASSASQQEFEQRLAALGLRMRAGDRKEPPIIEAADGNTFLGSLARLTRLRKAALAERLKFDAEYKTSVKADNSSSHLPRAAESCEADGARLEVGGGSGISGSTSPDGHRDRATATGGGRDRSGACQVGESGSTPGRSSGGQGDQERRSWLTLAAGCARHRDELLDLLGHARKAASPPLERVVSVLDDVIEQESVAYRAADLPEPASLHNARRKVEDEAGQLRALETEANGISQRLADHRPDPIWRRLWGPASEPDRRTLETRLDRLKRQILTARGDCAAARHALQIEERKFRADRARHQSAMSARRTQADGRIATARAARTFLQKNPRAAFWGAPYLMRVAANIQKARSEWRSAPEDMPSDWDLIPIFDLWGKPYLPTPKG